MDSVVSEELFLHLLLDNCNPHRCSKKPSWLGHLDSKDWEVNSSTGFNFTEHRAQYPDARPFHFLFTRREYRCRPGPSQTRPRRFNSAFVSRSGCKHCSDAAVS